MGNRPTDLYHLSEQQAIDSPKANFKGNSSTTSDEMLLPSRAQIA
ncbi:hypothetical protein OAE71_00135 [Synechococcus sp. AH-551-A21]|nr:hypothetical protein [Synechococcus sp. AH-551-A21]